MVKQVYRVKKDGRKCAVSDLAPNNEKPAELTLATKGKEVKQVTFKNPIAKSERAELKVPKVRKELPLSTTKPQPRCPLGLSSWQEKKLKRLSAEKLKSKNMAWVPKRGPQDREDVQAPVASQVTRVKNKNDKSNKRSGRRFLNHHQRFRPAHHPYYSTPPLMPMSWNSSPGMIDYPPWAYFDPWMYHNSLHHERVLPSHYTFD